MRIDVGGGAEIRVTEPLLNLLEGNAVCKQEAGAAVAEIVKAHFPQPVTLNKSRKLRGQIIRLHAFAQFIYENITVVFVIVAVPADLFVQLLRLLHLQEVFSKAADQRQGAHTGFCFSRVLLDDLRFSV